MLSVLYFAVVAALAVLSLTRRRIFVICGFYSFYALLTVLDEGNVPRLGALTVYRALYLIMVFSLVARVVQDRTFLLRMRRWPLLIYGVAIALVVASSLYSRSPHVFFSDAAVSMWGLIVIFSLFWMAAGHVHQESDMKILGATTTVVSLALSLWVIWHVVQLNFEAYRGGIEVNQNYVSLFVLVGALPLINALFTAKSWLLRFFLLSVLLVIVLGGMMLASRGMVAGFAVAAFFMVARLTYKRGLWIKLGAGLGLGAVITTALFFPGSSLPGRFLEGDVSTLDERTLIWSQSLNYFAESGLTRMLFGQGFASGQVVIRPVLPDFENYHNEYLRWLMDQGMVGLFTFMVFLYEVVRRVLAGDHPFKNVMIGWLAFLLVGGMSATMSEAHVFWILMGVMVGACALPPVLARSPQAMIRGITPPPPSSPPVPRAAEGL
jgi:O-antigen ligase/polysaccharide polymerase Wzy-like membrane protein